MTMLRSPSARPLPIRRIVPRSIWGLFLVWLRRRRMRRELADLNAAQLRDVGLDPYEVWREAGKPFWRP